MSHFYRSDPSLEGYWRANVLFGRNVASYKFALAKALFDLGEPQNELVQLDELAVHFSRNLVEHLKNCDTQGTSASSRFLDACRRFNAQEITQSQLVDETVRLGFNNVIDAFHMVNRLETPVRFFIDERKESSGIRLTDDFLRLKQRYQAQNLYEEIEARWRLVETAWDLGIATRPCAFSVALSYE